MKHIAQKAGVARQTVSKVINKKDVDISPATREKIMNLVKELNFHTNHYASSLKTGRTNCIGISTLTGGTGHLGHFNDPYLGSVYSGIGQVVENASSDIKLLFHKVNYRNESLELAQKKMVDGLIFVLFVEAMENIEKIKAEVLPHIHIPYVCIHSLQQDLGCHNVGLDCRQGGDTITEHLVQHGYTSIGCVKPPKTKMFMENLYQGYQQALTRHALSGDNLVFTAPGTDIKTGYELAGRLLQEKRPLPRALFVLHDFVCFGMIRKFREAGLRVPEDIALVTFEDEYQELGNVDEVTALIQPGLEKGRKATEMLLDLIHTAETPGPRQLILDLPLVVRKTCGCK
jgi:LacI family transcriptional regulator